MFACQSQEEVPLLQGASCLDLFLILSPGSLTRVSITLQCDNNQLSFLLPYKVRLPAENQNHLGCL